MSRYTRYYNIRQTMYMEMATRWLKWSASAELSDTDRKGVSMFFKSIAVRFGLVKEFRRIGII